MERSHLFDVHLGETVVPYATLEPLKALLPLKKDDAAIPTDDDGPGGIWLGGLEWRMRERWQTVSRLWEDNKALANNLNLLERLDYVRNLSSQMEWQRDAGDRPVRIVYSSSGQPTAAILQNKNAFVENVLFWVACREIDEANYLLAIINSESLYKVVQALMPKGQFGARHLHKHLWKLPIPQFDPGNDLHIEIAQAGAAAATGSAAQLEYLREQWCDKLTVTIARRELRKWLRTSAEGRDVEITVGRLLAGK